MSGYENDFIDAAVAEYNPSIDVDYDFRERSFMENVITSTKLQPLWQSLNAAEGYHEEYKGDDWKPLMPDNTKGYENFAWRLAKARNPDHEQLMKDQIDENQMLRQEEAEHGSWQGMLFSEVLNPVNYLPIPGVAGAGFFKGAVKMTAYNFPLIAGEEALRQYVDPTTEGSEFGVNVFYTSIFSAGIGGLVGKFLKTPDIGDWLDVKGKENDVQAKDTDSVYEPSNIHDDGYGLGGFDDGDPNQLPMNKGREPLQAADDDLAEYHRSIKIEGLTEEEWTPLHELLFKGFNADGGLIYLNGKFFDKKSSRVQTLKQIEEDPTFGAVYKMYQHLDSIMPLRTGVKNFYFNKYEGVALEFKKTDPKTGGFYQSISRIIRVSTNRDDPVSWGQTLDHEMIHALRHLGLFTPAEWRMLRDESNAKWMDRHDVKKRWGPGYKAVGKITPHGDARLKSALEEEGIAEGFRTWMINPQRPGVPELPPQVLSIFQKWKKRFIDLIRKMRGKAKEIEEDLGLGRAPANIDEIFARIERGDFKRRAEIYGINPKSDSWAMYQKLDGADDVPPTVSTKTIGQLHAEAEKVDPGAKKVFGFENVVQISTMGTLVQSGSKAIADLAMKMAGDFGFMLERNKAGAEATPQSAFLRAGIWDGMAIDAVRQADESFVRYLTDGATGGTKFGSVNVAAAAEKMKNKFGKSSNDKMSYPEFMTEVSKSFTKDGIEHSDPWVKQAAEQLNQFLEKAGKEGYEADLIPTTAGFMRKIERNNKRLAEIHRITGENNKIKNKATRALKQKYLDRQYRRLMAENAGMKLKGLDSYPNMEKTILDILAWGDRVSDRANAKTDSIHKQLVQDAYVEMKALQNFHTREGPLDPKSQKYYDHLADKYKDYLPLLDDPDIGLDEIFRAFSDEIALDKATPKQIEFLKKLKKEADNPLSDKQERYLSDLMTNMGKYSEPGMPARDGAYLPLVYDLQRIADDYALGENSTFRRKVIDKFTENARKGLPIFAQIDEAKIASDADEWITGSLLKMTESAQGAGYSQAQTMNGTFRWMRQRTIGFTHEEIADFVETDATRIVRDYTRAFGISLEFSKMFGSRDAKDAIDEAMFAAIDEMDPDIGAEAAGKILDKHDENLRRLADMTNGDRNRRHPLTWDKYAADSLRSWAAATMLGRVIKTVVPEVAHIAMVNGLKKTMGFAFKALAQDMDQYRHIIKDLKPYTIEGWDMASAEAAQRMIGHLEGHGPAESETLNKLAQSKGSQGWFNFAGGNLYNMNLLAPATEAMKTFQMVMSSHRFIDDIMSGVDPDRLASHGFTPDYIAKIRSLVEDGTIGKSNEDGLWHANVSEWVDGDLRAAYMSAVSGEIRRVVATAGPGDMRDAFAGYWGKPGSQTRFALGALPFQFMQFSIAATTKYTLSAAQGRDASPVIGLAMLVGMGYLSTWLKTPDWAWDKMTYDERLLRAVEGSGALALFGDMPAMLEQATANQYGIRPLLGLDAKFPIDSKLDQASLLWGPGGDKIADLYKMIISPDTDNRDRARFLRRSVPLNDLVYWHSFFLDADPIVEQGFEQIY